MPLVWAAMATQDRRAPPRPQPLGREISCSLAGRLSALFANMRGMRELHARVSARHTCFAVVRPANPRATNLNGS